MAEKTLRQIICETIHPEYKQKIKGCYECGEAERIADSILVSISARIKAKALTDEQINELHIKHGQLFREKWEIFKSTSTMTGLDYAKSIESIPTWDKYLAAAQLQAALKELGSK